MGKIHTVRIPPCDDSTYWQTGKLLFFERCIANGNCIALGFASACGGSNGHFAFDGDSGRGLFLFTHNAAAADSCSTGKRNMEMEILISSAAGGSDIGRTGFGALDGNFVPISFIIRHGFCAATDTSRTGTALCIFDGDIALDAYVAKAANTATNTGTFFAADGVADLSVIFNGYIADAKIAAANASSTNIALCVFDDGITFNGHFAQTLRAAANASAVSAAFGIFNDRFIFNDDLAATGLTTADASSTNTTLCVFDDGITFNGHCAQTLRAAANASRPTVTRGFCDSTAADGDSTIAVVTATNTGTIVTTFGSDIAASNCHIAVTADGLADGLFVTGTAANTGTLTTTVGSDLTARNGHLAVLFVTAADAGTLGTTRSSQTASSIGRISLCGAIIILFVLNRQRAAVVGLVMFQTGMTRATRQSIITVQLNVRIAAAGNAYSGFACFAGVDIDIIQRDVHRLAFICVDGDRVPRAFAGDGDFVVRTILDVSAAVADVFLLSLIHNPLADEIAVFRSVDINGAVDDIIGTGKSRKGHAGHHGTGESEGRDPLCGNAGRGSCLFLAEKHRNMPQDAHGESAIRDH